MGNAGIMVGALLLGAVGGVGAVLVAGAPGDRAPAPSPARATHELAAALERVERRVDSLAAAMRSRTPAPRVVPAAPAGEIAADATDAEAPDAGVPLADRVAALEARVAGLEARAPAQGPAVPEDLSAISSKELDALGRTLVQSKRHGEAQRVLQAVLERGDLDLEQRTEMEMQLGYALRGAGLFAEAEARFLETQRRAGEDSERGAWAGFQAAWDRYYQKDPAGASARMELSATATGVSPIVRVHSLYNAAYFAKEAGDNARARTLLERLLDNYAKDIPASQANMKTQAEAWLAEIRGY